MEKLKLIYNPPAGRSFGGRNLHSVIKTAALEGFRIEVIPLKKEVMEKALAENSPGTAAIIVAGGDGSLNWVVNTIIKLEKEQPPLAVLPWGTSNDFFLQVVEGQFSVKRLFNSIKSGRTASVDVGCVNDRYFINVAGSGLLVDVAHKTSSNLKQRLGMLAYYLEGAKNLPAYKPFPLYLKRNGKQEKIEVFLFLVMNGKGAGGLRNLAPMASLDDGKLDIVLIKSKWVTGLISLSWKLGRGQHIDDPRVEYFQAESIEIGGPEDLDTDIDGEPGPPFPLSFSVLPRRLQFVVM